MRQCYPPGCLWKVAARTLSCAGLYGWKGRTWVAAGAQNAAVYSQTSKQLASSLFDYAFFLFYLKNQLGFGVLGFWGPSIGARYIDLGQIAGVIAHEDGLAELDDDRQHGIPVTDVEQVKTVASKRSLLEGQEAPSKLVRLVRQCPQATAGLAQCILPGAQWAAAQTTMNALVVLLANFDREPTFQLGHRQH